MFEIAQAKPHSMLLVSEQTMAMESFEVIHVMQFLLDPLLAVGKHAVLVDADDPARALDICRRIRQHTLPAVYLVPIILLAPDVGMLSKSLAQSVDGVCGMDSFSALYYQQFADRVSSIHKRLAMLANVAQDRDTNLALKFLRYLFVRTGQIRPMHDLVTRRGYHYPELDLLLGRPDDNVFDILRFLEEQRLLTGEFIDKLHLCASCGSAFLNFRETCSHCQSANLRVEDLIHHFRCAHVAPLEDYQQGSGLRCPKCHHDLRQIGVDYDKPSSVYICRDCSHTTQEPETATLCFNCGTQSAPERLAIQTVKSYALTGLAENAALYGLDNLFRSILESELDILPLEVFKRFLHVEIERVKRYQISQSNLVMLYIEDLDRIYMEAGPRAKDIFGEFGRILSAALRPSDVITAFNDSLFLILATETSAEGAEGMASRVTERLGELIHSNFEHTARIVSKHIELTGQSNTNALIDLLVNQEEP